MEKDTTNITNTTNTTNKLVEQYIDSLSPIEKQTLEIAKEHLQTSFNIEKSIGFLKWEKKKKEN